MTAAAEPVDMAPKKASKLPLILGLVLAVAGAGGGYFAVTSGLIGGGETGESEAASGGESGEPTTDGGGKPVGDVSFVPIDPLVVSIPDVGGTRFLRFAAQLETAPGKAEAARAVMPRIVDVLNGYLRAVTLDELSDPAILVRLRGQMLRRVQVVTGRDVVTDLLIMEFVLN